MNPLLPESIPGVAEVELLCGSAAGGDLPPALLVEVPHGADERAHYETLAARLRGPLPDDLVCFFHANTDEGAWAYGRATAQRFLAARPEARALLVRSLIPRTFIDCNRPATYAGSDAPGGLTPGLAPYVQHREDRALLRELHARYVEVADAAYRAVCGAGGIALSPHTFAPRTVGIDRVDERIVERLRWAYAPERVAQWPLRPEIDLLTRDTKGRLLAPPGCEEALLRAFRAQGLRAEANATYVLHAGALGHAWASRHPGQVLSLEVRRDVLDPLWEPFREGRPAAERVARVADALAGCLLSLQEEQRA
ncbi:MAG: hypothetical protein D6731_13560 [Planctomycetota bacterium]|nr:MAG: hypothetical protein D6731_13560 [Planctomycetota bacterium]